MAQGSLVALRNIEDMTFIDIRKDLITYLEPQDRLVVAERSGFLQMSQMFVLSQGGEEAETDYLARLREAARYCKFVDLKATLYPEAEMIRSQFIAGLRDNEAKLKLLEELTSYAERLSEKEKTSKGELLESWTQSRCCYLFITFRNNVSFKVLDSKPR